jgi:hypothetical protein
MGLQDVLQDPTVYNSLVSSCEDLVDQQVASKGGLSGVALKTTYGLVKGVGPNYISGAISRLLPEVMTALDPLWDQGLAMGNPVDYLSQNRDQAAACLLRVTDLKAQTTRYAVVRTSYSKFRQSVIGDIAAAVPQLAQILDNHLCCSPR